MWGRCIPDWAKPPRFGQDLMHCWGSNVPEATNVPKSIIRDVKLKRMKANIIGTDYR